MNKNIVYLADNLTVLSKLEDESVDLVYIDPPFNTGKKKTRKNRKAERSESGSHTGFGGNTYDIVDVGEALSYEDTYGDGYLSFLTPRLKEILRILKPSGSVYIHLDYREAPYVRVLGDSIFGRDNFLNEIIWAYDYGGKPKTRWPAKHDTILMWVKSLKDHLFNIDDIDRIPYMAPGMVTAEKAARGKLPTDCYSADTEVLTSSGWKLFSCVTPQDYLATVSPDGELSYVLPEKLHRYEYSGPMIHFKTKTIDLLVTPNHNMYVSLEDSGGFNFITARCLHPLDQRELVYFQHSLDPFSDSPPISCSCVEKGEGNSSEVPYNGMVYCATVDPHHTLVVRRNGKSAVCGNCWWHTIVSPVGKEKTGYPTQKPMGIVERIVRASSPPNGVVLDCFAGSGTTGEVALKTGRRFILVDANPESVRVIRKRLKPYVDEGHLVSYKRVSNPD